MATARRLLLAAAVAALAQATGCLLPTASHYHYDFPQPAGSHPVQPPLPQQLRQFSLSPDRRQVAYIADSRSPYELSVATFGDGTRKLGRANPNLYDLQWRSDGQALLYVDPEERIVPGEYSDWHLPRTEILSYRLMQWSLDGSQPREILRTKERLHFKAGHRSAFLIATSVDPHNGGFFASPVHVDLETREQRALLPINALIGLSLAPDDRHLAITETGNQTVSLTLVALDQGRATSVGPIGSKLLLWQPDGQSLDLLTSTPDALHLERIGVDGKPIDARTVVAPNGPIQLGDTKSLSPDGKYLWAFGKGDTNLIISLETGQVSKLDSFGYLQGWLDDQTIIGTYRGGQYAVPISSAMPLTTSP